MMSQSTPVLTMDDVLTELRECRSVIGHGRLMLAATSGAGSPIFDNRMTALREMIRRLEEAQGSNKRPPTGFLEVGLSKDEREVVVNHPDLKPDINGVGHLVFSPAQAIGFGEKLIEKARQCRPLTLEESRCQI